LGLKTYNLFVNNNAFRVLPKKFFDKYLHI